MIVSGASNRSILAQYSTLSLGAIQRHKKHIPKHLSKAKEVEEITEAGNLLSDLEGLRESALGFLNEAKEAKDLKSAASLINAACKVIETLGEVRGELDRKATVNIIYSPAWIQTRTVILSALEPFPEARVSVAQALQEMTK
ncbi:hypothetical protein [uncultured Methanospirillum sp.]|uniref:hypothetical protein n=1 Tax=uncultured Methanospirillum sp. TaxID=262503 RepID=UPI0029C857C7|nr:hypothetical protein [uncultured Methanospirillum sp.]